MTDGLLLRELEGDPLLERYDTLILDEAHERNLNVDFLLGVCRQPGGRRPELRVIVTSATIETRRFAEFFGGAPVVDVEGRSYPVEIRYRPLRGRVADAPSLPEAVGSALDELLANGKASTAMRWFSCRASGRSPKRATISSAAARATGTSCRSTRGCRRRSSSGCSRRTPGGASCSRPTSRRLR